MKTLHEYLCMDLEYGIEDFEDIAKHGCERMGPPGLIFTKDLRKVFNEYQKEIEDIVFGYDTPEEFWENCIFKNFCSIDQVQDFMVWRAVEWIACMEVKNHQEPEEEANV